MISRVTTDMATERARLPKLKFCLIPRLLNDGRWIWLERSWVIQEREWAYHVASVWGYYLNYDEALVNHWEFGK